MGARVRRGTGAATAVRVVMVTLDAHLADAFARARTLLAADLPALDLRMHVAADFMADPEAAARCRADIAAADVICCTQLWTEELAREVVGAVAARRDAADAVCCVLSAPELMKLNKLGRFSTADEEPSPWSPLALLRRLRGERGEGRSSGERQLNALRTLPKLLRFIPGAAQDVRVFLLAMQYWLSGTDANVANLVRMLVGRYAAGPRAALRGTLDAADPEVVPDVGLWHPSLAGRGIVESIDALPRPRGAKASVGLVLGRSYLLAGNAAHYAAVVRALEERGLAVIPAFASALDARPAIDRFFMETPKRGTARARVDAVVNLTGFSLVGGPAYNDAAAAQDALARLDVPYLAVQALEFQTIDAWESDQRGLSPLQATLQVAIPELDGATGPVVFGGRPATSEGATTPSLPIADRVATLAARVARLVELRRTPRAERRVAVVLFNFPPNAGNTGSAAYLAVFESLQRTLASLKEAGYTVDLPESVDALRRRICEGNAQRWGAPANVHARIPAEEHVRREPHLADIERTWGAAPGRQLTDGGSLFVMGERFGNVFVGVQPSFGWEGDPMRLLFEGSFAPTHAFSAFYRWLREDLRAHAVLHFGTHGALEFMPGKQAGLSAKCWPDRLIGDLPNVYLYASNNSSEGTLAKRRGGATLVSYLTPPIARAGLYKGLAELKATLDRYRQAPLLERAELAPLVREQAAALDLVPADARWDGEASAEVEQVRARLLELEYSLIPLGLHVVGSAMPQEARRETLEALARLERPDVGLPSLPEALGGAADPSGEPAGDATAAVVAELVATRSVEKAVAIVQRLRLDAHAARPVLEELLRLDALLGEDHEIPGILRALDARYVPPAPGGDLLRTPAVLPTGRNVYGFDPYRVPSAAALLEGRRRAQLLLDKHRAEGNAAPETVAMVLWGSDNMKSEGAPLATALALMGAAPRFDNVGRLCGARLVPLEQLGRPRVDVVLTLSGIFRDLLPLQVRLLAEAALLCARADEPESMNHVRRHALAAMRAMGCDVETAALRVFSNADGAYGSNVNLLVETGRWESEDELADQFVRRKSFAYSAKGNVSARPDLMKRLLGEADLAFQNVDSVELGATDIDQYVESLGGVARTIAQQKGKPAPTYMGDHTAGGAGAVRSLAEQVALETRTRMLNPKWYEGQLAHGFEGVRNLAGHVTTTLGWSATAGAVPEWVYAGIGETFVLDAEMRARLARLNPSAASGMAERLLEATDRGFWKPDAETLARLRDAAAELEDRLEGVMT